MMEIITKTGLLPHKMVARQVPIMEGFKELGK
jgi:hypothetical protein